MYRNGIPALAAMTLAVLCGSTSAVAQTAMKYYARKALVAPAPVYKGTWEYGQARYDGPCDPVTRKRWIKYDMTCSGGACDPAKQPQSRFETNCIVQTCSGLTNYERFTPGTVVATTSFALGTPNMPEVARAWCADSQTAFFGCELEQTATNYVVRGVSRYDYYNSSAGPKFWAGTCTPG